MIYTKIPVQSIVILYLAINVSSANFSDENKIEQNRSQPSIYTSFGIGGNYFGFTFGAELSYAQSNNIFSIRYLSANELRFNVDGVYDEPALSMKEIGLLYGRYMSKDNGQISIAAGLGLLNGIYRGYQIDFHGYKKLEIHTLGLSFEGRFFLIFSKYSGMGFVIFGNLNPRKTFVGAMIEVHLGSFLD
jgi:hypothetical protein